MESDCPTVCVDLHVLENVFCFSGLLCSATEFTKEALSSLVCLCGMQSVDSACFKGHPSEPLPGGHTWHIKGHWDTCQSSGLKSACVAMLAGARLTDPAWILLCHCIIGLGAGLAVLYGFSGLHGSSSPDASPGLPPLPVSV